jgi:hypothetical protein
MQRAVQYSALLIKSIITARGILHAALQLAHAL